ncbi:MAG TPA: prepilin-type N-terminal cleavage/methylation domain-containing protein [Pirellulaceae bacterium]|nr:prepilin-type N-terminal cleavage/methylation domain-containing protein [Pirellulaceae bacterium]
MNRSPFRTSRTPRRGLSLLEVILAIAILGGALAAIGELIRLGTRSALAAHELSLAHLLADTRMAEVAGGALDLESVSTATCEEAPDWVYSVTVQSSQQPGLLQVEVLVQQDPAQFAVPISYRVFRFLPDPEYVKQLEEEYQAVY